MSVTMTSSRWWTLGGLVLAIALAAWIVQSIEWVDLDVPTLAKNEAARDRFYAAKSLVRRLGGEVSSPLGLDAMPPPGATLLLSSPHWDMFPGRDAALEAWVKGGGHLVIAEMPFFREQFVPEWAPLRNVDDTTATATAQAASDAAAGPAQRANAERCRLLSEPDAVRPAFGAARSFRVCGGAPTRLDALVAPQWSLGDATGVRMARVAVGQGSVAASTMRSAFTNRNLVADDGALAFVAALDLHAGDTVWFVSEEARAPFFLALASKGLPALLFAAAALVLALWRGAPRFGPLIGEPAAARRSVGEQVRRTAAFIGAGDGHALHRASLQALEAAASRAIARFMALPTFAERAEAIAQRVGGDAAALAGAMQPPKRRQALVAAITELERARRALLPDARSQRFRHALPTKMP
jgi:hypothetical protein